MPSDAHLTFADHTARFYAQQYGFAPMVGRVLGYLTVCDPPAQTIGELSEALLASRSAITGALVTLDNLGVIKRSRAAGERMDRVVVDMSTPKSLGFDNAEYEALAALAHEGLEVLTDASAERRAALSEMAALAEFLTARIPAMYEEWKKYRAALVESGELVDTSTRSTQEGNRR